MIRRTILLQIAALLGLLGCSSTADHAVTHRACAKFARTYFYRTPRDAIAEFLAQDLETQYTVYLCGARYVEPPVLYLAAPFGSEGKVAENFLKHKLAAPLDDQAVADVVRVLAEMQRQGTYDVKGDAELASLLRQRVQGMGDAYWKDYTNGELARITSQ
jgi:hypothetical protein